MINCKKKLKVPKKIRSFYYKDINFNIENYVLDKNIIDIPGNGNLMQSAINMRKNFYSLLVIFVILTFPIVAFFIFHVCTLVNINILNAKEINYGFGISSGILWLIGWIVLYIDIVYVNSYTNKQCKLIVNYFNILVQDKKLIADLKKYPVIFIMSFYYENRRQFIIDYPNTYPWFAPFWVLVGQSIFFDRLYDYMNRNNVS